MIIFLAHICAASPLYNGGTVLNGVVVESNDVVTDQKLLAGAEWLGHDFYLKHTSSPKDALELLESLQDHPDIVSIWPDVSIPHTQHFNDPLYVGQWYLNSLSMEILFDRSLGSSEITIAIIDSGIDTAHPDLQSKIIAPYDAYDEDDDPQPNPGEFCWDGSTSVCDAHGTAVAGIAAAQADNEFGMVGMCPSCSVMPIKMLGAENRLSSDIKAFSHAIDSDADVINNSWGYSEAIPVPTPLKNIIVQASTEGRDGKGILVVFAAGNEDRELNDDELCAIEELLCVSAVDSYGRPTNYTNYGAAVDVSAPSATVSIAPDGGETNQFGGTSAAAPVVSGLAAWALSERPDLHASELKSLIIEASIPSPLVTHDADGHHSYYGYGTISPEKLDLLLFPNSTKDDNSKEINGGSCDHLKTDPVSILMTWLVLLALYWRRT